MNPFKNALAAWARQRELRAVLAELAACSDRELAELGLARGDIVRVAREEAERRIAPSSARAGQPPALLVQGRYRAC
ncbi:DUF1127 domain-containing protein [Benzoatithermus flavus]|jgi:uncharacterized protein YjiS (DUF1127 family)|uniref:DUF1127 domain-containing protein n=1 Tax=Benzoatithermus flavus TaxID=3108223 RepID=A0ABU8XVW1_9PROT